jgi:hypothetical protein
LRALAKAAIQRKVGIEAFRDVRLDREAVCLVAVADAQLVGGPELEHWDIGSRQYLLLRRFIDQYSECFREPALIGTVAQVLQAGWTASNARRSRRADGSTSSGLDVPPPPADGRRRERPTLDRVPRRDAPCVWSSPRHGRR